MDNQPPPTGADQLIDAAARGEVVTEAERRNQKRTAYTSLVAVLLEDESERAIAVRAVDLSKGGMAVRCGPALPEGAKGLVQLVRSNGSTAFVGIVVRYCRYEGNGTHLAGLEFGAIPQQLSASALDEQGRMRLLDPLLLENADPRS